MLGFGAGFVVGVAAVIVAIIAIVAYLASFSESFASEPDKAQWIKSWFDTNPDGGYAKYKRDAQPHGYTDVVEYTDVRKALRADGRLTGAEVAGIVSGTLLK